MVHWEQALEFDDLLIQAAASDERTPDVHSVCETIHLQCEVRNEQYRLAERMERCWASYVNHETCTFSLFVSGITVSLLNELIGK